MNYLDRPENVRVDTEQFLKTELGTHLMTTLDDMQTSFLKEATSVAQGSRDWYLAKHNAIQEVKDLILQPLDDDKPSRG